VTSSTFRCRSKSENNSEIVVAKQYGSHRNGFA
jgi:hypothetical protein